MSHSAKAHFRLALVSAALLLIGREAAPRTTESFRLSGSVPIRTTTTLQRQRPFIPTQAIHGGEILEIAEILSLSNSESAFVIMISTDGEEELPFELLYNSVAVQTSTTPTPVFTSQGSKSPTRDVHSLSVRWPKNPNKHDTKNTVTLSIMTL